MHWPMPSTMGGNRVKPPRYSACVKAQLAEDDDRTVALIRAQCKEIYHEHEHATVIALIRRTWSRLAAEVRRIEPTRAEVDRLLDEQARSYSPAAARKIAVSDRVKQMLLKDLRNVERDKRLAKALGTDPENLTDALAKRYGNQTRCARQYRRIPECGGTPTRP